MKSLEEIKNSIEALEIENKSDIITGIVELVDAEKQKSIQSNRKLKADIETYRKYKSVIDDIGYDGSDLDEWSQNIKTRVDGKQPDGDSALKAQLNVAMKKIDELSGQYNAERQKAQHAGLREMLSGALVDEKKRPKTYANDLIIKDLIRDGAVKFADDGKTVIFDINGQETTFDDGIKTVLDMHKDKLVNYQNSGAGSSGGGSGAEQTINRKTFDKLTPSQKLESVKGGIKIID